MNALERMTHAVLDEIDDLKSTTERFELHEQPGAAEKLPGILERARALAEELNELCGCEHLPPSLHAQGLLPPADSEPEHAR
jgi:hypothetical protein